MKESQLRFDRPGESHCMIRGLVRELGAVMWYQNVLVHVAPLSSGQIAGQAAAGQLRLEARGPSVRGNRRIRRCRSSIGSTHQRGARWAPELPGRESLPTTTAGTIRTIRPRASSRKIRAEPRLRFAPVARPPAWNHLKRGHPSHGCRLQPCDNSSCNASTLAVTCII